MLGLLARTYCCREAYHIGRERISRHPLQKPNGFFPMLALATSTHDRVIAHYAWREQSLDHVLQQSDDFLPMRTLLARTDGCIAGQRLSHGCWGLGRGMSSWMLGPHPPSATPASMRRPQLSMTITMTMMTATTTTTMNPRSPPPNLQLTKVQMCTFSFQTSQVTASMTHGYWHEDPQHPSIHG